MDSVLTAINSYTLPILWGWPVLLAILTAGIFYTVLLKGFQIWRIGLWMRYTVGALFRRREKQTARGITPFQSVSTALAGSIGTGNIVGVATAITMGGPGALFWMWVSAFFGMMTIYAETVLGLLFRKKDSHGRWIGGIRRIAAVTETIVPFMSLLYLAAGIIVLAVHWSNILPAFGQIFAGAFSVQGAVGGIGGYTILTAMKSGISRGIFTNEAGLGSSVMAHAAADTKEPCEQGMWAIFQVFVDTIVVCTLTGLCILSSGVLSTGADGGALSSLAFESVFGVFGKHTMTICVIFFAFATMLGWSYYGECAVGYLFAGSPFFNKHMKIVILIYRLLYAASTLAGSTLDLYVVWDFCGNFNGFMAIPNLYALFRLSPKVRQETKRYLSQKT